MEPAALRRTFEVELTFAGFPKEVFPLLCPVREYDWISDWSCVMVYTDTGIAEPGCIFRTSSQTGDEIWTVVRYEPNEVISFLRVTPGFWVILLELALEPAGPATTAVTVTSTYTALGPVGTRVLTDFDEAGHRAHWQHLARLAAHYLTTGTMLHPAGVPETSAAAPGQPTVPTVPTVPTAS